MHTLTIDSIINQAESLDFEDQLLFFDIFQRRLNERRRDEIANNGKNTLKAIKEKKANIGSVQDFLKDIENE